VESGFDSQSDQSEKSALQESQQKADSSGKPRRGKDKLSNSSKAAAVRDKARC
jgi:hypothetical protein